MSDSSGNAEHRFHVGLVVDQHRATYTIGSMSTTGAQTVIFTPANAANGNANAFQVNSCR